MLGASLKKFLERYGTPDPVRQVFREGKRRFGRQAVRLSDPVKILNKKIKSLPEVFICTDGLDECLPKNRQEFFGVTSRNCRCPADPVGVP